MTNKRAAVVQDLSCVGGVSGGLALSVLAAAGVQAGFFPAAVYTSHTGFAGARRFFLGELLPAAKTQCEGLDITFDLLLTGYLAKAQAVLDTAEFIRAVRARKALHIADPVMGDGGRLYSGLDAAYVEAMKELCAGADVILPNATEACLLLDIPYSEPATEAEAAQLMKDLCARYGGDVVLTGLVFEAERVCVGVLHRGEARFFAEARADVRLFGTGDLFAAVVTAALAKGRSLFEAAQRAGAFTAQCARDTALEKDRDPRFGVDILKSLPLLRDML